MNPRIIAAALIGVTLGAGGTYLAMQDSGSSAQIDGRHADEERDEEDDDDPFAIRSEEAGDPFAADEEDDWLSKLSGKWVSADGQQSAELDLRTLRINEIVDWPDISNRYFLIGKEMKFMTNSGYYNISTLYAEPDEMRFIKEDLKTGDLTSFTLYREGTPRARSREPLVDKIPPARVQDLLDAIPTIKAGEKRDSVMKRLGLADDESLELLGGERSMGYSDTIFSLGVDNEWMLRLDFSVESPDAEDSGAVIRRFQLVRGYVDDVREGRIDIQKLVYPYFTDGQIVAAPTKVEQNGADQPATASDSKPEEKKKTKPESKVRPQ